MPELKASVHAGKSASGSVSLAVGAGALVVVGVLLYLASRSTGPLAMPQFTEKRMGPLMEHLVTKEELGVIPGESRMHYPHRVAPGTAFCVQYGFAPMWKIPDPQVAALPAEEPW